MTEFRALISGKVHRDKSVTAPNIDFAFRSEDDRAANRLHLLHLPMARFGAARTRNISAPLRLYFTEEGLYAQYPATQSLRPWSQFIWLSGEKRPDLGLLSPGFDTILPKRTLGTQAGRLEPLFKAKIKAYDYRKPNLPVSQQIGSLPQTS